MKYGVIIGSLREGSYSRAVSKGIIAGLPEDAEVTYLEIAQLPLYSEDYDKKDIPEYTEFRKAVAEQDAFIFVSPEHNRNIPAALKNAIDIASRPVGENVWAGKPALIATGSTSGTGGMLSNHAIRQTLVFVDMIAMPQPEMYLNFSTTLNEDNSISEHSADYLKSNGQIFDEFTHKILD